MSSASGAAAQVGGGGNAGGGGGGGGAPAKGRRLSELRVAELRAELERRGLDRQGVKAVLVDRLHQAIKDEGQDPEDFVVDAKIAEKKHSPAKKPSSGSIHEEFEEGIDEVNMDNLVVKDEVTEDDNGNDMTENEVRPVIKTEPEVSVKTESAVISDNNVSTTEPDDGKSAKKREAAEPLESSTAKKICKEEKKNNDVNGMDVEDSINLDIGEDEFLNEEGEAGCNTQKDEDSKVLGGAVDTSNQHKSGEEAPQDPVKQESAAVTPASGTVPDEKQQENAHVEATASEDSKNNSVQTDADKEKEDKDDKKPSLSSSTSSRNLWVSGLSGNTRAKDLKQICSRYGKVTGAKVVTNARTPGSRCFGYVMMSSAEDANNCIKHLHRTELHGRMISMEKAKSESTSARPANSSTSNRSGRSATQLQRSPRRSVGNKEKEDADKKKDASKDIKKEDEGSEKVNKDIEADGGKEKIKSDNVAAENDPKKRSSKSKTTSQERRIKDDRIRDRARQERARHRRLPVRDFLSFTKIRKEREAQRAREHVRRARSEERRRRAAEQSLRELERRQRAEKHRQRVEKDRLALEREKLRIERERIEREKQELHRLERERQKLERDRLELERLELKRAQIRLEEERGRAAAKRNYLYASSGGGGGGGGGGSSNIISRSKQPLPPPPPTYDRPSGRTGGESGGSSNPARFNMSIPTHMSVAAPAYEMPSSSSSSKPVERGGPSARDRPRDRDRQRDFKRDYPPAPRHSSSSHTGGSNNAMKYPTNGSSYEPRQPLPPGTRPRDQRYGGGSMETNETRGNTSGSLRERQSGGGNHDRSGGSSGTSYRPSDVSRRSPKPTSRDHRYSDSTMSMKNDGWQSGGGGGESGSRYSSNTMSNSGQYSDSRYGPYQPAPPGIRWP